jgi:hypothetical protein
MKVTSGQKIENNKNRLKKDLIAQIESWKTKLDQIAEVRKLIASMKSLIEGTMRFLDQMEERC